MESIAIGVAGFGLGLSRIFGHRACCSKLLRTISMDSKDKAMFAIALIVLVSSFTLIAVGKSTTECFGLIGLILGHFFGREMGKSERP